MKNQRGALFLLISASVFSQENWSQKRHFSPLCS